ncbi:MAG: hypothetical protein HUU15_06525, partial [Candidatus Brocadiae bacterium]|nr:hypothetical protein [Candidatus Brocadiia bacterium]
GDGGATDGGILAAGLGEAAVLGAIVEAEVRHPVNLLTAHRAVIAACLEGLSISDDDVVSAVEADRIAAGIEQRRFRNREEFATWLHGRAEVRSISAWDERAILTSAHTPGSRLLRGTGSLPFSFQSWNCISVDAQGVADSGSGGTASVTGLREVIEAAPAGPLLWRVRSQQDFLRPFDLGLATGMWTGPANPAFELPSNDRARGAWLTAASAPDLRGPWPFSIHFDGRNDGMPAGEGMTWGVPDVFRVPSTNLVTWRPGAVELWFRAGSGNFTVLEAGDREWSDRMILSYEGVGSSGGAFLRLSVKDGTLEKAWTQVTHPVALIPGRWYHAGVSWEATRPGGMMLLLDGLPVGSWGAETASGQLRHVHLAAGVSASDTELVAREGVSGFPVTGVLRVGAEAIEYASRTGSRFMGCRRGARGTTAAAHPADASATWWGYAAHLVRAELTYTFANMEFPPVVWEGIGAGDGRLAGGNFGTFAETVTVVAGPPDDPPRRAFLRGAQTLPVPPGTAEKFPDRGYLLVGTAMPEIVHYEQRTGDSFRQLQRGCFGTEDADHVQGESVSLYGFHVSTHDGYPSPTILCIDGELFGPVQKAGNDAWIGVIGRSPPGPVPLPLLRETIWLPGLPPRAHENGAKVLPTFALPDLRADRGDRITLMHEDGEIREERTIAAAVWLQQFNSAPFGLFSPFSRVEPSFLLVGLDDAVAHDYVPDGRFVRALRWPSGELPSADAGGLRVGFSEAPGAPGALGENVDEIRSRAGWPSRATLARPLDAGSADVFLTDLAYIRPGGGAVHVDDELIGYTGFDPATGGLTGVLRGYLGTTPRGHALGAAAVPAGFLGITRLLSPAAAGDGTLALDPDGLAPEGYLLIDREVVGYTRRTAAGVESPRGCNIRGAFGTDPAAHPVDSLALALPFRYFDRFVPDSDDSRCHSWSATRRATGAVWRSLRFEEFAPLPSLDVRVQVRFNHAPRWSDLRRRPGAPPTRDFNLARLWPLEATVADEIEVRVGFDYLPGAWTRGEWKEAPLLRRLEVEFEQPVIVHRHEER